MHTEIDKNTHDLYTNQDREEVINIILNEAVRKIDNSAIPIRNADHAILEAIYRSRIDSSNKLSIDYLAGIIANASRLAETKSSDYRLAKKVIELDEEAIMLHQIICNQAKSLNSINPTNKTEPGKSNYSLAIPFDVLFHQMRLNNSQPSREVEVLTECLQRLQAKGLITRSSIGDTESLLDLAPNAEKPGIAVQVSSLGMELFFWSRGEGNL